MHTRLRHNNRVYSPATRQQVVQEAMLPGANVPHLAQTHGIARSTIYKWRRAHNNPHPKFVAVTLAPSPATQPLTLHKAVLEFADLSLTMHGKICRNQLLTILEILDGSC